ncbi:MAG: RluA family pseudouridine synthase [Myxococcales bacterium]|nr:RluA family pseudouridine synthase [Myxococcales bacterium]
MISILYEDPSILIVDKPAGMPTDATVDPHRPSVISCLRSQKNDAFCVHRLDKDTTGVLVVAKNKEAQTVLNRTLSNHQWRKLYLAVVRGRPEFLEYRRQSYLAVKKSQGTPHKTVEVRSGGKKAITEFFTVVCGQDESTLCCSLLTGRTHQVRVHCAALGLPVLGDRIYGPTTESPGGLFLFAWQVGFPHPVSGQTVRVIAPPPKSWCRFLPHDLSADTLWNRA